MATGSQTREVPIAGMDCAEGTRHVQHASAALPGVRGVEVYLAAEKAVVELDPARVDLGAIRTAAQGAGYSVPAAAGAPPPAPDGQREAGRRVLRLFGLVLDVLVTVVLNSLRLLGYRLMPARG